MTRQEPNMVTSERTADNVLVLRLQGRLDAASRSFMEAAILGELQSVPCAVFDLSQVTFIASEGLRMFLMLRKRPGSAHLLLCNLQDQVREVFEISGLLQLFDVFAAQDAAEQAARSRQP